jgi:MFS family permease
MLVILGITASIVSTEAVALMLATQDLERDLALTDTQMGLLQGLAFILFYSFAGLAIARWVDRGNRVAVISLTAAAWAISMAASAIATSFMQLVLLRAGLAIGEAGCNPAAQSLIADYFDRAERPRVNGIYGAISAIIGQLVGSVLGGKLNEVYGWRWMFMTLSLPGFAIAIWAWFTLREPRLGRTDKGAEVVTDTPTSQPPPLKDVIRTLWSNTTLRHLYLFLVLETFAVGSVARWQVVFFMRNFGLKTGELGVWFAYIAILGCLGPVVGGAWCSRYAANNEPLQFRAVTMTVCGLGVLFPSVYLVHDYHLGLGLVGLSSLVLVIFTGPTWSLMQTLIPKNMLASGITTVLMTCSVIGAGLGPLAVGALSDALQPRFGNESLIYASLALCPAFLWAAWHSWQVSKSVSVDLTATQDGPRLSRA